MLSPATSSTTLEGMRELRVMLESVLSQAISGADRVRKMLESLELMSVRTLKFETVNRLSDVVALKKKLESVTLSFDSLTKFLVGAASVLMNQADARKRDRDNLIVLAQYPLAKKIIQRMLSGQTSLALAKLPYQRRAAGLYAELYASGTPGVEYDENEETLTVRVENA